MRRRTRFARMGWILAGVVALACLPPTGGWDLDRIAAEHPALDALRGQRLGDMIPFPVLLGDRVGLVACRFDGSSPVRVAGLDEQTPPGWTAAAVAAVDRMLGRPLLEVVDAGNPAGRAIAEIDIVTIVAPDMPGPRGLGDTLMRCDVSPRTDPDVGVRGTMVHAEIRMRRSQRDMLGQVREATPDAWVGALMHELGHALGFAGHAAGGDTILVLEQSHLRAAGRRALAGEAHADATLRALYALRPGTMLGERRPRDSSRAALAAAQRRRRRIETQGGVLAGIDASVGDREARILWRYADGREVELRMPDWPREVQSGGEITLELGPTR